MLARACLVALLAVATCCVGPLASARVDVDSAGVHRGQACGLDAAALGDAPDAEGDEADGDSSERDWSTLGPVADTASATAGGGFLAVRRHPVARHHGRAVALIRGPPLRG